jgi:hypothetical protein
MSPLAVQKLRTTIALVFNTERYGGKLIQRDDSTIMLKDYRCMSVQLLHLIQEQFPQVDITVQAHEDSASGFVMLFVMRDNPSVPSELDVCASGHIFWHIGGNANI